MGYIDTGAMGRDELRDTVRRLAKENAELRQAGERGGGLATTPERPEGVPEEWGTEGQHWFRKSVIGKAYQNPHLMDDETRDLMSKALLRNHVLDDLEEPAPRTAADMKGKEGRLGGEPGEWYRDSQMKSIGNNVEEFTKHEPAMTAAIKAGNILDDE